MEAFADDLEPLIAIAACMLDSSGVVIEANAGFRRVLGLSGIVDDEAQGIGVDATALFIQPDLATLSTMPVDRERPVYNGLMTVGNRMGSTHSLLGRVWHLPSGLRVLAEYDVDSVERANSSLLELNTGARQIESEVGRDNLRLRQHETEIVKISLTDPLTGAWNRRRLMQSLAEETSRAERTGEPLSAFIADIDLFKSVNDHHGHDAGDRVLVRFVEVMATQLRPTDILTRYGGEEFVALLPSANLAEAVAIAERIRTALRDEIVPPLHEPITASFGAAELQPHEDSATLLVRIDEALYRAKETGRDRVMTSRPEVTPDGFVRADTPP